MSKNDRLFNAVKSGNIALVTQLFDKSLLEKLRVKKSKDINKQTTIGITLVHEASRLGHAHIVQYLLEKGAEPNIADDYGRTPMHTAARWCDTRTIALLIKYHADINAKDASGITPLYNALASSRMDYEVIQYLLTNGANPNIANDHGRTPIHTVVRGYDIKIIELLIKHHANINVKDEDGVTPLCQAIETSKSGDKIAQYLLEKGADPNITNGRGQSPLHIAARVWQVQGVEMLLKYHADINKLDNSNRSALHIAAQFGKDTIVKYLVEHQEQYGVIVNHLDIEGTSIMHYYNDNPTMQRFLFENGVVPDSITVEHDNLQDITHDAQSVHATPAVKQMKFYIQELINTTSNQDAAKSTNALNLSNELNQLFNSGAKSKNIDLLSLPKSEKADLFKPIFDHIGGNIRNNQDVMGNEEKQKYYQALLDGNNIDFVKEIISQAAKTLDKWSEKDSQGNYKHGKATATMQYDYNDDNHGKVMLPETLVMIRSLIEQKPALEEKRELFATFCDNNKHIVSTQLSEIQNHYPNIKNQNFSDKASVHQLLSHLDDKEVSKLYNIVSNEDIDSVLKEQKLFTLAKSIYVSSIAYGENSEACFGGAMQQIVATAGEISPVLMNKYTEYLDEEQQRITNQASIDDNNVLSVVEAMSDTLIEQVKKKHDIAMMLSEATLRVKAPLESIPILDPNNMTLEQQKLLSSVHKACLNDIKKVLPNYTRDIPTREELALVVNSLDKSPKLQQWSLSYEVPTHDKRKSDRDKPTTNKQFKTEHLSAVDRLNESRAKATSPQPGTSGMGR